MSIFLFDKSLSFASLAAEHRRELERSMHRVTLNAGELLCREGELGEAFYGLSHADDMLCGLDGVQGSGVAQPTAPCQMLCEQISDAVVMHHGSMIQEDDIALLAIRALSDSHNTAT